MGKSNGLGIARFTRQCPLCPQDIKAGSRIARQKVNGRLTWVHEDCYMPPRLEKAMRRLDEEFLLVVGGK